MTEADVIAHWQQGARNELASAKLLSAGGQYAGALFHCHLAVEKALKARYMQEHDCEAPLTHDLLQLALPLDCPWAADQKRFLADLTQYAIAARYDDPVWAEREATRAKADACVSGVETFLSLLLP